MLNQQQTCTGSKMTKARVWITGRRGGKRLAMLRQWKDYYEKNDIVWEEIEDGLNALYAVQSIVSSVHPASLDGSLETTLQYMFALEEEIHELARALQWKPWKDYQFEPDNTLILKEFSDILAFIGILMVNIGKRTTLNPDDFPGLLAQKYRMTSMENVQRLVNNGQLEHEAM